VRCQKAHGTYSKRGRQVIAFLMVAVVEAVKSPKLDGLGLEGNKKHAAPGCVRGCERGRQPPHVWHSGRLRGKLLCYSEIVGKKGRKEERKNREEASMGTVACDG